MTAKTNGNKIQSEFINKENRLLYHEIYFTIIRKDAITYSQYLEIEELIEKQLNKIKDEN